MIPIKPNEFHFAIAKTKLFSHPVPYIFLVGLHYLYTHFLQKPQRSNSSAVISLLNMPTLFVFYHICNLGDTQELTFVWLFKNKRTVMLRLGVHLKSCLHCSQHPILHKKVQESSNTEKWNNLPLLDIIFILTHKREFILP